MKISREKTIFIYFFDAREVTLDATKHNNNGGSHQSSECWFNFTLCVGEFTRSRRGAFIAFHFFLAFFPLSLVSCSLFSVHTLSLSVVNQNCYCSRSSNETVQTVCVETCRTFAETHIPMNGRLFITWDCSRISVTAKYVVNSNLIVLRCEFL